MANGEWRMARNTRKKRTLAIHMDPRNYYEFDGIAMDFNSQKLNGVKGNKHYPLIEEARFEFTRERDNKGPKMLHTSSSPNGDTWFSTNHQLLAYDHLIAVDTNTNNLNGSTVSITAAYHLIPEKHEQGIAHCRAAVITLLELWNVAEKPENLGWYQVLNAIEAHPNNFIGKIGLIVDSDLGEHQAFNSREKPIFGDYYLPDNVTIIYGSDKGGAEHLSTKMIKYCHDLAADLYKKQNLLLSTEGLNEAIDVTYSHFRQWDTQKMDLRSFSK
jgi:hypothetical protein